MFVSVVMAVHNGARFIGEAIESILEQTYRDLELVVVDDASTDGTAEILEQVRDRRVRVIYLPENRGGAAALNTGIARARGAWIAIHDADDISDPARIAEQMRYITENPGTIAAGTYIECITDEQHPVSTAELRQFERFRNRIRTAEEIRLGLYSGCPLTHGTIIFSKAAFLAAGGYNPRLRIAYDYDLFTRLVTAGPVEIVPQKLYRYRRHRDSLSASKNWWLTNNELFYSFARYVRSTCFNHRLLAPVLAVCGGRRGAESFARQAQGIFSAKVVHKITPAAVRQLSRDFQHHRLDGAVVLDNFRFKGHLCRELLKSGMVFNENLFLLWCRI